MGFQQMAKGTEISGQVSGADLTQSVTPHGQEDARLNAQRENSPASFDVAWNPVKAAGSAATRAVGKEAGKLFKGDDKKDEANGQAPTQTDPSVLLNSDQVKKALEEYRTRLEKLPEDSRKEFDKALTLIEAKQSSNGGVLDAKNELRLLDKLVELRDLTKDSGIEASVLLKKDGQIEMVDRARGQVNSMMESGKLTEDQGVERLTSLNTFDRTLRPKKGDGKASALDAAQEMKLLRTVHELFDKPAASAPAKTAEEPGKEAVG